mgnify:CR=1 FL=1
MTVTPYCDWPCSCLAASLRVVAWLAVRGVAGTLPFQADTSEEDAEAAAMDALAKEAKAFRRDR